MRTTRPKAESDRVEIAPLRTKLHVLNVSKKGIAVYVQFVVVNGRKTRVIRAGDGPPLVLLHPLGHSADVFIRNIDVLACSYSVYAPDLPGHGFSDDFDVDDTPPQLVARDHVLALMDGFKQPSFVVAGSSFGGLVAALIALHAPRRVRKLCVIGSASTFTAGDMQQTALQAVKANASTAMQAPTLTSCRGRLRNICYDGTSVAEEILPLQMTYYALPGRFSVFVAIIEAFIESTKAGTGAALPSLEELAMPTLVIVGRHDAGANWRAHEEGVKRMRDGRIVIIEECGHLPYMEQPQRFNDSLLGFLAT